MQEEKAYASSGVQDEFVKYPGFGDSKTNPIQVHEFYSKWRIFESHKHFKWADQYFFNERYIENEENRYYKR